MIKLSAKTYTEYSNFLEGLCAEGEGQNGPGNYKLPSTRVCWALCQHHSLCRF